MSKRIKAPALMAVRMVHAKQGIGAKAFKPSGTFSVCVSESIPLPVNAPWTALMSLSRCNLVKRGHLPLSSSAVSSVGREIKGEKATKPPPIKFSEIDANMGMAG